MGGDLRRIESIGAETVDKLNSVGVSTLLDLRTQGATREGRKAIADAAGVPGSMIPTWVNNADLHRAHGVRTQDADLLGAAGVDMVVELATRRPDNLHARLVSTNEERSFAGRLPTESQVGSWVAHVATLLRVVSH